MHIIPPIRHVSAENAARPVTGFQRGRGTGFAEIMAAGMDSGASALGQVRRTAGSHMRQQGGINGMNDKAAQVPKDEEIDTAGVIPFVTLAAAGLAQNVNSPEADEGNAAGSVADILEGQTDSDTDMDNLVSGMEQSGGAAASPADEILARMPETTQQTDIDPAGKTAEPDGGSCPLENASDTPDTQATLQQAAGRQDASLRAEQGSAENLIAETNTEASRIPAEGGAEHAGDRDSGLESKEDAKLNTADSGSHTASVAAGFQVDAAPLRVQGESQMVRQAEATSETLMDTMVEEISLESAGEKSTVEIQLKPEFLGKVSIQLTMDGNGIHARIRAEDPEVKGLIGGQINQLIQSLEQKGIRMAAVDVVYTGAQAGSFEQGGRGREGMNQENRNRPLEAKAIRRGARGYDSAVEADAEAEAGIGLDSEISSVEYRA